MADRQYLTQLSKKLADDGKLVEAGWIAMRVTMIHPDAPPDQLREMRLAFMAGAQHLFGSIMTFLDDGVEPTEQDEKRMSLINDELSAFEQELRLRIAGGKEAPI